MNNNNRKIQQKYESYNVWLNTEIQVHDEILR